MAAAAVASANIIGIVTDNDTGNFTAGFRGSGIKIYILVFINDNVCLIAFVRAGRE